MGCSIVGSGKATRVDETSCSTAELPGSMVARAGLEPATWSLEDVVPSAFATSGKVFCKLM